MSRYQTVILKYFDEARREEKLKIVYSYDVQTVAIHDRLTAFLSDEHCIFRPITTAQNIYKINRYNYKSIKIIINYY